MILAKKAICNLKSNWFSSLGATIISIIRGQVKAFKLLPLLKEVTLMEGIDNPQAPLWSWTVDYIPCCLARDWFSSSLEHKKFWVWSIEDGSHAKPERIEKDYCSPSWFRTTSDPLEPWSRKVIQTINVPCIMDNLLVALASSFYANKKRWINIVKCPWPYGGKRFIIHLCFKVCCLGLKL